MFNCAQKFNMIGVLSEIFQTKHHLDLQKFSHVMVIPPTATATKDKNILLLASVAVTKAFTARAAKILILGACSRNVNRSRNVLSAHAHKLLIKNKTSSLR